MISALLIDDEEAANQRLRWLLEAHPEVEILGEVGSVAEAIGFLTKQSPDVIFLDVNMPGGKGLELLPVVEESRVAVIFVTAHQKYAVPAFDAGAVDYLVKPVNPRRLALMIPRLLAAVAQRKQAPPAKAAKTTLKLDDTISFAVSGARELKLCQISEIAWIEAMQNYTRIQLKNHPATLTTRRSLGEWEALLSEPFFYRLNRSLIIQVAAMRLSVWNVRSHSLLTFEGVEEPLPIGRHAAARLKEILVQRERQ